MFLRTSAALLLGGAVIATTGCGARSRLISLDPEPECETDDDCDQSNLCSIESCVEELCVALDPVICTAPDECSVSECNPESGECDVTPLTRDADRDGFRSPLPGFEAGEPGSCGLDCDDTSALSFPGGAETCDGVDNDCDGVIDNNSSYFTDARLGVPEPTLLPTEGDSSGGRGAAYGEGVFAMSYWAKTDLTLGYLQGRDAFGNEVFPHTPLSNVNAPSFGADVAWGGDAFATVWSDPRVDDNYEVYFTRFDVLGQKLGPDVRLTDAPDFSIHSRILFDQGRYLVAWDDRRDEDVSGGSKVFLQLVDPAGEAIDENVQLTDNLESAEYPALAATEKRYAIAYTFTQNGSVGVRLRVFDKDLSDVKDSRPLEIVRSGGRGPRITAVGDVFLVTWDVYEDLPGPSIMGMLVDENQEILLGPEPLTFGATFARSHDTLGLGDRFLLLWSDDQDGNYEIYGKTLDLNFGEVEPRTRLTNDGADTVRPEITLGEGGTLGVLFDDWRAGTHGSYFMALGCSTR